MANQNSATALDYLKEMANQNSINELTSRELAQKLDESDKLAHLRQNFYIPRIGTLPEGLNN
jgi:5-methylcytosine-specific restriction endonuclease McrBC regulatory subunit McrC